MRNETAFGIVVSIRPYKVLPRSDAPQPLSYPRELVPKSEALNLPRTCSDGSIIPSDVFELHFTRTAEFALTLTVPCYAVSDTVRPSFCVLLVARPTRMRLVADAESVGPFCCAWQAVVRPWHFLEQRRHSPCRWHMVMAMGVCPYLSTSAHAPLSPMVQCSCFLSRHTANSKQLFQWRASGLRTPKALPKAPFIYNTT